MLKPSINVPFFLTLIISYNTADNSKEHNDRKSYMAGSFGYDLEFLQEHNRVVVLKSGAAYVVVSPKYSYGPEMECSQ
jgi:hypothetical protein